MTHNEAVALAVDVGGTGIKCAIVDLEGAIRHAERHPTGAGRGPDAVLETVLDVAADLARQARGLDLTPISVGVVIPGVVADGVAIWSANLGLRDAPVRRLLAERLCLPAALGHDVRAGALAEARLGAGRTTRRLLFVALGTGIAGGFVLDGRIDDGAHGAAGEIGHIVVRSGREARSCRCGRQGCLEMYASAAAIARAYADAHADHGSEVLVGTPAHPKGVSKLSGQTAALTAEGVAGLVAQGDPMARRVWDEAVSALADGLLTAIALYDPAVIAIGGGLGGAGELLLEPLRDALQRRRTFHQLPAVVQAELGDEAGVRGAALLALDAAG